MVFSSFTFLCYFLPLTFLGYFILPSNRLRNIFLLFVSLIFYAWNEPQYLIYLLGIISITYLTSLFIKKAPRISLCIGICSILSGLFYFKYTIFTLTTINRIFASNWSIPEVIMPIGISFYTFQAISYLIDIYHNGNVQKNFFKLALYISMFPQLVAGPIIKYNTIQNQLENRQHSLEDFYNGFRRFLMGLGKKIIIADTLSLSVDRIFSAPIESLSTPIVWVGIIFYALQIYFDFSAYSDMAIGLGKIFGFKFLENFNYPYLSKSISEFWRRWHISLSTWFKEYVYIPLGGNKKGGSKTCINLTIVFLLTGIWHGANWTFILWGLWFAIFIILEKCFKHIYPYLKTNIIISVCARIYTLLIILFGWVLFKCESLSQAYSYFQAMFGQIQFQQDLGIGYYVRPGGWLIFTLAILFSFGFGQFITQSKNIMIKLACDLLLLTTFMFCIIFLTAHSYSPFIYFNF